MSKVKPGDFVCAIHVDQHCRREDGRNPHALYTDEPGLTQQHFAEECDINEILRRSAISGQLPVNDKVPMYGDFSSVPKSLSESFAMIKQANDLFMTLPWEAREKFKNDPQLMIQFLQDPANKDEAVRLGLVKGPPPKDEHLEALKSIDEGLRARSGQSGEKPEGGSK